MTNSEMKAILAYTSTVSAVICGLGSLPSIYVMEIFFVVHVTDVFVLGKKVGLQDFFNFLIVD